MQSFIEEVEVAYQLFVWKLLKEINKEEEYHKMHIRKSYTLGKISQLQIWLMEIGIIVNEGSTILSVAKGGQINEKDIRILNSFTTKDEAFTFCAYLFHIGQDESLEYEYVITKLINRLFPTQSYQLTIYRKGQSLEAKPGRIIMVSFTETKHGIHIEIQDQKIRILLMDDVDDYYFSGFEPDFESSSIVESEAFLIKAVLKWK
ncbi:hypothetical protein QNI19_36105 [Cytophagaceae bacterium DM2B3-1]|uniref:Uncharacterized protein n=1 Tax=Xanthocytophaga flava TaxID=3048013 RepID=A0ABT7CXF9_9BACT|nr:hypothetical protein [Xanthocytophaga flavus]MDJ1498415.1 hypothetical protein [Xanthocytophaga flavus]